MRRSEMQKKGVVLLTIAAILLALSLSSRAKADDWDKKTIVTFDQDVGIPGQVLPAGTYVFKLFRSNSDRFIVQVWDGSESQLLATLMTIGDSYPNPRGKAYFVLDTSATDEGYPPAVVSWFFAGTDEGRDFMYSGYSTTRMLDDQDNSQSQPED
jgi:hypothetical protein